LRNLLLRKKLLFVLRSAFWFLVLELLSSLIVRVRKLRLSPQQCKSERERERLRFERESEGRRPVGGNGCVKLGFCSYILCLLE
jgi:hypothetical protein